MLPASRPGRYLLRFFTEGAVLPHSMTGFGAAEGSVAGGRLRIELRTVNHRFFNFAPKLPSELSALEADMRERLRQEIERGHVALSARWVESPAREAALAVDLERAQDVTQRLRELRDALGIAGDVTLDLVARQNLFENRICNELLFDQLVQFHRCHLQHFYPLPELRSENHSLLK